MSDKPSYLGLLNAVAIAERRAGEYLGRWAATTSDPNVRATLHTIALREAEHGLAFAKRIDELGFEVQDRDEPDHQFRLDLAGSTELSDREKFEQLRLTKPPVNGHRDVFDAFFENKDLDPVTGSLLGRYIAEERDSGRRFAACYQALVAESDGAAKPAKSAKRKNKKK